MVAQSSAVFPIFRGQRGRGFGALAKTLGRTAFPFINSPSCKKNRSRLI